MKFLIKMIIIVYTMIVRQITPPLYLKEYVRYFWTMESYNHELFPQSFGPLVDGFPGLILQSYEQGKYFDKDKPLPEIFLYGQTVKRTELQLVGKFQTLGICFFPTTLKSIFGFNANEVADSCLAIDLLSPTLKDELLNSPTVTDQIAILSSFLYSQIKKNNIQLDKAAEYATLKIFNSGGNISLRDVQQNLRISERSLERKFNQSVGISPKLYARICRFQASLEQLKKNNYSKLTDVAYENGYSDQSHFIREFKEFAGYPPFQFERVPLTT